MLASLRLGSVYQSCRTVSSSFSLRPGLTKICCRFPPSSNAVSSIHYSSQLSNQMHTMFRMGSIRKVSIPLCQRIIERQRIPGCRIPRCQIHISQYKMATTEGGSKSTKPELSTVRPSSPCQPPMPPPRRPSKKMTNFVFQKFIALVQGYQQMMTRRFPQAMHVSRVFFVGFKDFSKELAESVKIKTKDLLSSDGVLRLSRDDLDLYYRMPGEIFRVGPTLLLSALPGFQYIIFPIAYKFPKRLLSSHFWSLQQKSQFAIESQKKRLLNQRPVLRQLQNNVESVRDDRIRELCRDVLFKLGSGSQPSIREIMKIKPLFESDPFSIKAMHGPHVKALCRLHGIHTWFFNRSRLYDRAEMLYVMDLSLIREGIFTLKPDEIRSACFCGVSMLPILPKKIWWNSCNSGLQCHLRFNRTHTLCYYIYQC